MRRRRLRFGVDVDGGERAAAPRLVLATASCSILDERCASSLDGIVLAEVWTLTVKVDDEEGRQAGTGMKHTK